MERDHLGSLLIGQVDTPLPCADPERSQAVRHGIQVPAQQDQRVGGLVDDVGEVWPPAARADEGLASHEDRGRLAEDVRAEGDRAPDRGSPTVEPTDAAHPAAPHDDPALRVDEVASRAHEGGARVGVHRVDLLTQTGGIQQVVAADELDELPPRGVGDGSPVGRRTASGRRLPQPHPRVGGEPLQSIPGAVRRAVIAHQQLEVGEGLGEDRLDRRLHELRVVERGDDDRDPRARL
ncbi:MAG: hypothetical protein BWY91_00809 [bacterium ADurb.BinA028]|nr:MAG: hypothetical protein BWY91_00809 [bacterium ADurb.BinA028]